MWMINGPLILLVATILSLCAPVENSIVFAEAPILVASSQQVAPASLQFVGPKSEIVAIVRPASILKQLSASVADQVKQVIPAQIFDIERLAGVGLDKIDQLTVCQTAPRIDTTDAHMFVVIKTTQSNDAFNQMIQDIADGAFDYRGADVNEIKRGRFRFVHFRDAHTAVWTDNRESMQFALSVSDDAAKRTSWYSAWETHSRNDSVVAVNQSILTDVSNQWLQGPTLLPFNTSPEVFQANFALFGLEFNENVKLNGSVEYKSKEAAKDAKEKIQSWVSFAEFLLQQAKEQAGMPEMAIDMSEKALQNFKVDSKNQLVTAETQFKLETKLLTDFLASMTAAQARIEAMHHSRQVALGLHVYLDANGHFPPPVILGENGTVHSWRIAILPYIEELEMYRQYRFNEPWDSPHNARVTSRMPEVFRHPGAPEGSLNPSFFVVTGEGTMFNGSEGTDVRSVRDGMSATMMIVEAKRDTHWAKPGDISLENALMPNALGGYSQNGFIATFADGSTRFIDQNVDIETIRKMFTIDGGEVLRPKNTDDQR